MAKSSVNKKIAELQAGWLRTQADFDNYKKKTEQDKANWTLSAKEEALTEILPILDNIYFAMQHKPQEFSDHGWVKGLEHISAQINEKLHELGISRIQPRIGETFDPLKHDALASKPSNKVKEGKILEIIRPGYKIDDKVIRPAQVNVSK